MQPDTGSQSSSAHGFPPAQCSGSPATQAQLDAGWFEVGELSFEVLHCGRQLLVLGGGPRRPLAATTRQRAGRVNVEFRAASLQHRVRQAAIEQRAAAVQLRDLAVEQPLPAAVRHPRGQHAVERQAAQRGQVDATRRPAQPATVLQPVHRALDVAPAVAEALRTEVVGHALRGDGPFTVFAPTDEAFAQIPEEQLNALLADKEALTAVLTYHVVSGKVMAEDVVELSSAETVNGQSVEVKVWDGKVMIDDAQVTTADIDTTNGVIHVINKVLLPEM